MICAEADAYWCLCKLLDGIQDHYTHAQPGIQRTVFRLEELVRSVCSTQVIQEVGTQMCSCICSLYLHKV